MKILFEKFRFPASLYENSKKKNYDLYKNMHYLEVMKYTWSCHLPVNEDEPCGYCVPCTSIIKNNMEFRFPDHARKRILRRYRYRLFYKIVNKLRNIKINV